MRSAVWPAAGLLAAVLATAAALQASASDASTPCGGASGACAVTVAGVSTAQDDQDALQELRVHVLRTFPHDPGAYTQGLLIHEGWLYESTGRRDGEARLRKVDPATGVASAEWVLPPAPDGTTYWGEGLARIDRRLIQLTYVHQTAFEYDLDTFAERRRFSYVGEGWGLCHDGARLVMTNGSDRLVFRDPDTFEMVGDVAVTVEGLPLDRLNELECVGQAVYANVFTTDLIVRIDPATGRVTGMIDASGLLSPEELGSANVLNGIAYDDRRGTFLITGKWWPKLFEVVFEPVRRDAAAASYLPLAIRNH